MFGVGPEELVLILIIALIVLGPERMPKVARDIGRVVGDLDLHRIPAAGHWSAYENAGEVNRLMLEFFTS